MKATHLGTCQICQSSQRLPSGRVAVHGYSVDYGIFLGACRGSGSLPLEESCDLLRSIRRVRAKVAASLEQEDRQHLLRFVAAANKIIKAWAPRPLVPVIEEIASKQAASDKRTGLRDAARRRDAAKRELSRAVEALNAFAELRELDDLRALPRATSHEAYYALPDADRKALDKAVKAVTSKWSPYQASNVSRAGKAAAAVLASQTDERWIAAAREVDRLNADYLDAVAAHAEIAG